jgi:hypothetical protein
MVTSKARWRALLAALLTCLALGPLPARAYDNDNLARTAQEGPHRLINGLALERHTATWAGDPILRNYRLDPLNKIAGMTVVEPGLELVTEGKRTGTFGWWVQEGGYTADEPELFAAFRHFYDPFQQSRDPAGNRVHYLTDHLNELDIYFRGVALVNNNPKVDAVDWAIVGSAKEGWRPNAYCWNKGLEYMRQAMGESTDANAKLASYAAAWRALGETMHLMADMTCPPHVRNDSHPAYAINAWGLGNTDPNVGLLKGDPYETWCRESLIARVADGPVDPDWQSASWSFPAKTPAELMDRVASYTNWNFFSGETVSGRDPVTGQAFTNANGQAEYQSPRLEETRFVTETGYYLLDVGDKPDIKVAHVSWLSDVGWGSATPKITLACVESQASVLIPLAISNCVQLLDWFVPRMTVKIDAVDLQAGTLQGTVAHHPYGAYATAMPYSAPPSSFLTRLFLNGAHIAGGDAYQVSIQDGQVRITFGEKLVEKVNQALATGDPTFHLAINLGGIDVVSEPFTVGQQRKSSQSACFAEKPFDIAPWLVPSMGENPPAWACIMGDQIFFGNPTIQRPCAEPYATTGWQYIYVSYDGGGSFDEDGFSGTVSASGITLSGSYDAAMVYDDKVGHNVQVCPGGDFTLEFRY